MEALNRMLRKIRSLVSNSDYIEKYDDALSDLECNLLINLYEKGEKIPSGNVYLGGVKQPAPHIKKGEELKDMKFSHGDGISNIILPKLKTCITQYYAKYEGLDMLSPWKYDDAYTFKKFEFEDDGYKHWHTEHGIHDDMTKRILVWMFYLNNAKSGTDFLYYPTVKAKRGRCIIWPASWSHLHKSSPNKGIKYIISGWISYQ